MPYPIAIGDEEGKRGKDSSISKEEE